MNRSPDDFFEANQISVEIISQLSKIYENETEWLDILLMSIGKIIYHTYEDEHFDNIIDRLASNLKIALKRVKQRKRKDEQ